MGAMVVISEAADAFSTDELSLLEAMAAAAATAIANAQLYRRANEEIEERRMDEATNLRTRISEQIEQHDTASAAELYQQLVTIDPKQCLSERHQLELARAFYNSGRFPQAAAAFDRYLESYPDTTEARDIRLLLGIIYARDLRQYETADRHLTRCFETLRDDARRKQCFQWLSNVRAALGQPAP